ncbi:MAG TPA: phosphomannomutase, partial [Myxococcales bacterium]
LLEILSTESRKLSQLLADVPKTYASPELRVDTVEERKFEIVKRATEVLRQAGYSIVDIDGVRVTFPDGWGLIRASNTQPLLVLRFEAKTRSRLMEIQQLIESTLEKVKRELRA